MSVQMSMALLMPIARPV